MTTATDRLVIDMIAAHHDAPGDWTYFLVSLIDDRAAVVWYGAERPWTSTEGGIGEITCPVGDNIAGDHSGAKVFDSFNDARDYYQDMIDAVEC